MSYKEITDLDMKRKGLPLATHPIISIVMPVYNEEFLIPKAVPSLYDALISQDISFEILLCENGSTDSTYAKANELANSLDEVNVLKLNKADYGSAIHSGITKAKGSFVFVFDIDYYNVEFLNKALSLLRSYDIVIASKLAWDADDKRSVLRRLITKGFSLTLKILFNTSISETHGMKAFRHETVEPFIHQTLSRKDLFDTELMIRAERSGLHIKEVPVTVEEKRPTRSNIFKRILRTAIGLLSIRYMLWREGSL